MNKVLTTDTEKDNVGGKSVFALYLVPEGYEKMDDENGYTIIVKKGTEAALPDLDEDPGDADVPF
jgi:hypothetical protein